MVPRATRARATAPEGASSTPGRTASVAAALLAVGALAACGDEDQDPVRPVFVRIGDHGIDFVHRSGAYGRKHFAEINQGGGALFDADGDGALDLLLCQGAPMPGSPLAGEHWADELYLGDGRMHFEDATAGSGLVDPEATFAAAVEDVDADGDLDVLLVNLGRNRLFLNQGAARFGEAIDCGLDAQEWSAVACFADFDVDGAPDLYVGNYVVDDLSDRGCGEELAEGHRSYCHPALFPGLPDRLYRHLGTGASGPRFEDLGPLPGAEARPGKALGLVPFDHDDDGDLDLFVANDSVPNFLWRNEGALRFVEVAADQGVATNGDGRAEACMGSDAADVDGDGFLDLVTVNMVEETHTLWRREADVFVDGTRFSGLAAASRQAVGFGARLFDADLDGWVDLFVANGHVLDDVERYDPAQRFAQPDHLYLNLGRGKFELADEPALSAPGVGRGVVVGDLDDDGDLDVVVMQHGAGPLILENKTRDGRAEDPHWLGLDLGPAGIGARVEVEFAGRRVVTEVRRCASYGGSQDPRVRIGLGAAESVDRVRVRWPGGEWQEVAGEVDREVVLWK